MYYICNKCWFYTWNYIKKDQVVKNWKRWNKCPKCESYNNKKEEKVYLQENKDWINNWSFQDEKRIKKGMINKIA